MKRLKRNAAKCLNCETVIESRHRHHCKSCKCGDLFVDGGLDYTRFGYKDATRFEDLSEYEEVSEERLADEAKAEAIWWEYYGKEEHRRLSEAVWLKMYEQGLT